MADANTFALYRQEWLLPVGPGGSQLRLPQERRVRARRAETENAYDRRQNMDIPPTSTVCLDCGASTVGYAAQCPVACGSTNVAHLHNAVRFAPQRIVGDTLAASEFNTLYTASHGNWRGFANDGTIFLPGTALSPLESQMQPGIRLYRYNQTAGSQSDVALDSMTTTRSDVQLRWNAHDGTVRIGDYETVRIEVDPADLAGPPAHGAGHFYNIEVTDLDDSGVVDSYDENGAPGAARVASVGLSTGVLRQDGGPADADRFAIHPDDVDGFHVARQVNACGGPRGGYSDRWERAGWSLRHRGVRPEQIGQYQFARSSKGDDRSARFASTAGHAESEMFGTLSGFTLTFCTTTGADPVSNRDDIVIVDYSTAGDEHS